MIGIIDADLIGRKSQRFPNLACMKLSASFKAAGKDVKLLTSYDEVENVDEVYISKVFTDTPVPDWVRETDRIHIGGTGFFFDKAPRLPYDVEHSMPDYHLYDGFVEKSIQEGKPKSQFRYYTDYSIGFTTRGCFRKCPFCVNQNYDRAELHSALSEFYDDKRKKICLLDDNVLSHPRWHDIFDMLIATGKPWQYNQGLDERLLTDEKCKVLFTQSKYDGDYIFAFDNIKDYDLIESKLKMIRKYSDSQNIKFYVLVGFEGTGAEDIENAFKRIHLLMRYKCLPYIMRYQSETEHPWEKSRYRGMYVELARWCNQPSMFKKLSFREFCKKQQACKRRQGLCSSMRALWQFESENPEIARKYFDCKYGGA